MKNPLKELFNKIFTNASKKWSTKEALAYFKDREDGILWFNSITIQNTTPDNSAIEEKDFIQVIYKSQPMWALFKCPCGCNTTISLSLQKVHNPHWQLIATKNKRPTLYPSIWQKSGCYSHFWVSDGYIYWVRL